MMPNLKGVLPLVCACCGETVGVINATEFLRRAEAGEDYICTACMKRPEADVEESMSMGYPGEWATMTLLEMGA